jgi:hypothetical protein
MPLRVKIIDVGKDVQQIYLDHIQNSFTNL